MPHKPVGSDEPAQRGCGLVLLGVAASIALLFVSARVAALVGAVTVGLGLVVQLWPVLVRSFARVCLVTGAAALAAGAVVGIERPWPVVAAGFGGAGLLTCLAAVALAARSAPAAQRWPEQFGIVLFYPGVYLAAVGIGAMIAGARPSGQVSLVVAGGLLAVAVAVSTDEHGRWYWRIQSVAAALVAALGVAALFFDRYRTAGVFALGLAAGFPLIRGAAGRRPAGDDQVPTPWGAIVAYYGVAATVAMLFVSDRLALIVGAAAAGIGLFTRALEILVRPVARICFLAGAGALVAGTAVACYQPSAPVLVAVLFGAGVLGCAAGLIVSARPAPPELTDVVGSVLLIGGICVGLAGFGALVVHARVAGQLALVAAATLIALSVATWASQGKRWHGRVFRVAAALGVALGGSALIIGPYRLAGLVLLGLVVVLSAGYAVVPGVRTAPQRRRARAARAAQVAADPAGFGAAAPILTNPDNVAVRDVVADALRLATQEHPDGQALTTGQVLAALVRVDFRADWQRIWLYTGDPVAKLRTVPDPDPAGSPAQWPVLRRAEPAHDRLPRPVPGQQRRHHARPRRRSDQRRHRNPPARLRPQPHSATAPHPDRHPQPDAGQPVRDHPRRPVTVGPGRASVDTPRNHSINETDHHRRDHALWRGKGASELGQDLPGPDGCGAFAGRSIAGVVLV
jgi:hypothetical protein